MRTEGLSLNQGQFLPWICCVSNDRGSWHGDVAIKVLELDKEQDNQAQLQAFKREVRLCATLYIK